VPFPPNVAAKLGRSIRMLSSNKDGDVLAAAAAILRLLASCGADIHTLAAHVENGGGGGLNENDKKKIRSEIENARAIGYAEGVRAAEARFRPDGKLEFSEVALAMERQINRLPPDKHKFIRKMALYAREEFEPTPKQGKFLFDLFIEYLGGRIT
jgi:hypothetical protein